MSLFLQYSEWNLERMAAAQRMIVGEWHAMIPDSDGGYQGSGFEHIYFTFDADGTFEFLLLNGGNGGEDAGEWKLQGGQGIVLDSPMRNPESPDYNQHSGGMGPFWFDFKGSDTWLLNFGNTRIEFKRVLN